MTRRYKYQKYTAYDKEFAHRREFSGILNSDNSKLNLFDKNSLLLEKIQLAGSKAKPDYFALKDQRWQLAKIPSLTQDLKLNEREKADELEAAKLAGNPTDGIEKKYENQKLILEAKLDIAAEELRQINKRIKQVEEEEQANKSKPLPRGTIGAAKLRNGVVSEIDGMKVSLKNGFPTIVEPDVKYTGMKVIDYRQQVVMQRTK
jgi:hypothetical protein